MSCRTTNFPRDPKILSTGGVIALAMGVKDWRMRRCIDDFVHLCGVAFTPRSMHDVPILRHLIPFRHAARYETSPLLTVLKSTFGEQRLFGGDQSQSPDHGAKVAVIATDEVGRRAVVLANYSRKESKEAEQHKAPYEFLRRANPELELRVWEAAAATSATPSYFKPYEHEPTKRTYLDGTIYHNNPILVLHDERKLLWPDVANRSPDILLSIGTSQNAAVLANSLADNSTPSQSVQQYAPPTKFLTVMVSDDTGIGKLLPRVRNRPNGGNRHFPGYASSLLLR